MYYNTWAPNENREEFMARSYLLYKKLFDEKMEVVLVKLRAAIESDKKCLMAEETGVPREEFEHIFEATQNLLLDTEKAQLEAIKAYCQRECLDPNRERLPDSPDRRRDPYDFIEADGEFLGCPADIALHPEAYKRLPQELRLGPVLSHELTQDPNLLRSGASIAHIEHTCVCEECIYVRNNPLTDEDITAMYDEGNTLLYDEENTPVSDEENTPPSDEENALLYDEENTLLYDED